MHPAIMRALLLGFVIQVSAVAQEVPMPPLHPDQLDFPALYKQLVETNTTLSAGSCTLASQRMAARLKVAGHLDKDATLFAAPDHLKEGGIVAISPGRRWGRSQTSGSKPRFFQAV